jgi:hypothetical protein
MPQIKLPLSTTSKAKDVPDMKFIEVCSNQI